MSSESNKRAMQAVFEALARGDARPFGELMAEDCVWHTPGQSAWAGSWRGKKAMNEQLFAPLYQRFEGLYTCHAARLVAEGNVVVVQARGGAALKGGGRYENSYCFVCEFGAGGKLAQVTEYMDSDCAVRVLGAPTLPQG